jgi:siroheme synthase-like protein
MYLPLHIDLHGKKVLVIGFGKVGKRRAEKLLKAGASVSVIDRKKMRTEKNMKFIQKNLRSDTIPPLKGYFLVVASTDDKKLNAAIARKAKREGCLVNRTDLFKDGNVIFPAIVETGAGILSFASLGRSPQLSKRIKKALEHELPKR